MTDDAVNHPKHYNSHPSGVECIDIIRYMPFGTGSVFKYLWRAGLKDSEPTLKDYKKALWYLQDEIARLEKAEADAEMAKRAQMVSMTKELLKEGPDLDFARKETAESAAALLTSLGKPYVAEIDPEIKAKQTADLAAADSFKNAEYVSLRVQNNMHGDRTFSFTPKTTVGQAAAKVAEFYGYTSHQKFSFTCVGDHYVVTDLGIPVIDLGRPGDNVILVKLAGWYGAS